METIDEVDESETFAREQYWIEFYNSIKNGYNTTIGGEGSTVYSDDFIRQCWESGMTYEETTEKYGMSKTTLLSRYSALYSEEDRKRRRIKNLMVANGTPVYQYDRNGNYIGSYFSVNDATRKTGIHHIDQVARGERNHAGGFVWSYVKKEAS